MKFQNQPSCVMHPTVLEMPNCEQACLQLPMMSVLWWHDNLFQLGSIHPLTKEVFTITPKLTKDNLEKFTAKHMSVFNDLVEVFDQTSLGYNTYPYWAAEGEFMKWIDSLEIGEQHFSIYQSLYDIREAIKGLDLNMIVGSKGGDVLVSFFLHRTSGDSLMARIPFTLKLGDEFSYRIKALWASDQEIIDYVSPIINTQCEFTVLFRNLETPVMFIAETQERFHTLFYQLLNQLGIQNQTI